MNNRITRRSLLVRAIAGTSVLTLAGCKTWFSKEPGTGEKTTRSPQQFMLTRIAMAQEFSEKEISPNLRNSGTSTLNNQAYNVMANNGFSDYRLKVDGLVDQPMSFSLEDIRALPSRTQITRLECVEGWSTIGKWKGARLGALLEKVQLKPSARYVIFHCADHLGEEGTKPYYESIDLDDAFHPQTILAYELNDKTLTVANGAPLRVRVERQLGYKMAKFILRLEIVDDFSKIAGGKGGYWEDIGLEWYAAI
jgi:DMSO/TMAO reductase YedYZ molybdopterin-dependent catalytic subunit